MFNTVATLALSAREIEVVSLVATGLSAKEIASKLSIARCTVERHVENARLKTGTRSRTHMVAHAISNGLLKKD